MKSLMPNAWLHALSLSLLAALSGTASADGLYVVQTLRAGGCGGLMAPAAPLQKSAQLDQAAQQWAGGQSSEKSLESSGYQAQQWATLHYQGPDNQAFQQIRSSGCRNVLGSTLHDIGIYHQGRDTWLVMAVAARVTPSAATVRSVAAAVATPLAPANAVATPVTPATHVANLSTRATTPPPRIDASRVLDLVNAARAHGAVCGSRSFAPVPPVHLSSQLADVAYGHATDMADHNYFEHEDLQGHTPADRVKAAGYAEKLVGENIAYGPTSADEVVQGWLDSPGHCENIMDPRFAEMGIAYAPGRVQRHGLYWVQLLVAPRA